MSLRHPKNDTRIAYIEKADGTIVKVARRENKLVGVHGWRINQNHLNNTPTIIVK